MNKVKYLSIVTTILLILNILLIAFILLHKPNMNEPRGPHGHMHGPRNIIIEKLDFDNVQIKLYDEKIKWHQEEMFRTQKDILALKRQLYSTLNQTQNVTLNDSLILEINKVQNQVEHINIKHFEDIKTICKPNQMDKFKDLSTELADLFSPPKRRPPYKD
jgi:hypothetical protein